MQVGEWQDVLFSRFHLIRCHSSYDFLATLAALPRTLRQLAPNGTVQLLLIDNLAAYYWQDRAHRQPQFGGAATACGQPVLSLQRVHSAAAAMIQVCWLYVLVV